MFLSCRLDAEKFCRTCSIRHYVPRKGLRICPVFERKRWFLLCWSSLFAYWHTPQNIPWCTRSSVVSKWCHSLTIHMFPPHPCGLLRESTTGQNRRTPTCNKERLVETAELIGCFCSKPVLMGGKRLRAWASSGLKAARKFLIYLNCIIECFWDHSVH